MSMECATCAVLVLRAWIAAETNTRLRSLNQIEQSLALLIYAHLAFGGEALPAVADAEFGWTVWTI